MTDRVGEQLGNYRLLRLLGRGGFAEVYLGEHIYLKNHAALKVLHRQLVEDEANQFIREAQSLARLNHPGIVRVLDFAVQDGIPFLVTEYAAHGTLRERHPKGTRVPLAPLISYVQQIAAALHYAHSLQLIHRDIKPENMLIGAQQEVLLADFGLVMFAPDGNQTIVRSLAGSVPYMAPEQLRGEPVPASDQYALGVVVYEWLCGKRPFEGTPTELTKMHLSSPPPSLRLLLPSLPVAVEYVIMRALAKEPSQRFASVQEFATALYHASQEALFSSSTPVANISTDAKAQHDAVVALYEGAALEPMTDPTQPLEPLDAVESDNPPIEAQTAPPNVQFRNVPAVFTPLLGRELEVLTGCSLLKRPDVRLLSLLGMGGLGKTRLSIEIASRLRAEPEFEDGICFVALAAVREPEMVMPTIARALSLQQNDVPTFEQVKQFLQGKHLLLVLDNVEQVIVVAPQIEQLLVTCPAVKILVTSRIALRIRGEQQVSLPPLPMPDLNQLPNKTAVAQFASVMLFVQRAQAMQPTFQVTQDNVKAIAEICVRLDGLPLAIELAAARVKLLPPPALLARLSNRLRILTRGPDTLPERQQTLRNTIQWSYDLLDEREQRLYRLLSIFVGGCTLSAVEALYAALDGVESDSALTVLDDVETLIDNSLLQMREQTGDAEEPRLLMLETIREYGRESLLASGELAAAQLAHTNYYLSLAETAQQEHEGAQQIIWSERLERDYDNLRATMEWSLVQNDSVDSAYRREVALRLGSALENFWVTRGYIRVGLVFMERTLANVAGGTSNDLYYAYALCTTARLLSFLGDLDQAENLFKQSLVLLRNFNDQERIAYTLRGLGWMEHLKGHFEQARVLYEESLAVFRALNDKKGVGDVLLNMGYLLQFQGAFDQSRALFEEYLAIQRERENKQGIANALYQLAQLVFMSQANPPHQRIRAMLEEAIAISRTTGDKRAIAHMQRLLGHIAYLEKDNATAFELLEECIQFYRHSAEWQGLGQSLILLANIVREQGNVERARLLIEEGRAVAKNAGDSEQILVECLESMAALAIAQGQNVRAVRLSGAAAQMRQKANLLMWDSEKRDHEHIIATLRDFFGESMFAALWAEGQAMSVDEVLSARGAAPPTTTSAPQTAEKTSVKKTTRYPGGLSSREVDVLRLVAQGLTDIQIAEKLVISPRTVTTHLTSIYNKLGVTSRSVATRFAVEHHIL